MAPESDFPNIDLLTTPEVPYNPEIIADKFVWPLIDSKWQGDYRRLSSPSMPIFCFPKNGFHNGKQLTVTIEAGCDLDIEFEEESETKVEVLTTIHDASIYIEESTPEILSSLISLALEKDPQALAAWLEESDESGQSLEHQLQAISTIIYCFEADGDLSIRVSRSLRDLDGYEVWNATHPTSTEDDSSKADEEEEEAAENDGESLETSLGTTDIDNLLVAAVILGAPKNLKNYLRNIRDFPENQ